MEYSEFLKTKNIRVNNKGFDIEESELNPMLFDFQKYIVKIALSKGKYAIFAECGLGKTLMQLEFANQIVKRENKNVLILAPLAVSQQTINEGFKFGIKIFKECDKQINPSIYITNYEQIHNINLDDYIGIVLDESSILKNFEGKTKNLILESFANYPYKLCCTATPSPNDPMELGNHSEFLDVMNRNEMLSMFFVHDGGETSKWRLKKHAVNEFYKFVNSWAIMINNPSDIGFNMQGYDLPKLNLIEEKIITDKKDNGQLFNDVSVNAIHFNAELRDSSIKRLKRVAEIANSNDEQYIIWIKLNDEGRILKNLIPDAVEVRGSDSNEYKEDKLIGFANKQFRVLITKSKIAQFGMNYQNCHNQIFASLDFSFESLYQSIRRSYRFGQKEEVNITLITTDTMQNVIKSISNKEKQYKEMQNKMVELLNQNYDDSLSLLNCDDNFISDKAKIYRGDACQLIKSLPDESIDFSVFSPPFANLYTYSNHLEDMGNSKDINEFNKHFEYLAKDLFRVVKQGRNIAIHCMDLPIQKGKDGYIGLRDFSGTIREIFESQGFIYHSRITIWKDPVIEMQRTKALGLLFKQTQKDATMSRVGLPDYVLVFRKDGERNNPVKLDFNVDTWQKYASPVWFDIDYSNTLQYMTARDNNDERHICPLQLDTIKRLIYLYTNKGDTVLTPFMGIGSEVYQSILMERIGIGFELKQSYFNAAIKNIKTAINQMETPLLFQERA